MSHIADAEQDRQHVSAVHSIDHFTLQVPDLDEAGKFFGAFGLRVVGDPIGLSIYSYGGDHCWAKIIAGSARRLAWVTLSCYARDFSALCERVKAYGGQPSTAHPKGILSGFWFTDPDGNLVQLCVGEKTTPYTAASQHKPPEGPGGRAARPRSGYGPVQPARLSHILFHTPDIDRAIGFYQNALGLGLSDRSRDIVAFMHGRHGSDHHLIAFASSNAKGWHHSAWDVPSVDDVGRGASQMAAAGYTQGWGTGRHVLGSNYFYYVQDPWGSFAEYSAGIDFVPGGEPWIPMDVEPEDALHLWGPELPSAMLANTETPAGL